MSNSRSIPWVAIFMVLGLVIAGCGSSPSTPGALETGDSLVSPLSPISPLALETKAPTPTTVPAPSVDPDPLQLVVLHTNDNWGETEPCG
jgi:hypothetical protein